MARSHSRSHRKSAVEHPETVTPLSSRSRSRSLSPTPMDGPVIPISQLALSSPTEGPVLPILALEVEDINADRCDRLWGPEGDLPPVQCLLLPEYDLECETIGSKGVGDLTGGGGGGNGERWGDWASRTWQCGEAGGGRPGQHAEAWNNWASHTGKRGETCGGRLDCGGDWAAKSVKRPPQQLAQPRVR